MRNQATNRRLDGQKYKLYKTSLFYFRKMSKKIKFNEPEIAD